MGQLSDIERIAIRAGVVQHFEITYELCWKLMARWLNANVSPDIADGVTRRHLFRLAAENRLITDVERWMGHHKGRNATSHIYDYAKAEAVWYRVSGGFRKAIRAEMVVLAGRRTDGAEWCALGDLAEITMGQSPPGSTVNRKRAGTPLLNGPTEFGPHHPVPVQHTTESKRLARKGDLLFCVRGSTTGRMNWADRQYAIGPGVAAIRHRRDLSFQPFVRAVVEFALPELLIRATGSTFPNVSARQLAGIPCPSFARVEQLGIAHVVGTLDDKIELNRRMNETLESMARALFKSWFVDFDRTSWQAMSTYKLCRPADAVAGEFRDIVSPMLGRIIWNVHESRTLVGLRDVLLPKLISGEIRIREAEKLVEAVA